MLAPIGAWNSCFAASESINSELSEVRVLVNTAPERAVQAGELIRGRLLRLGRSTAALRSLAEIDSAIASALVNANRARESLQFFQEGLEAQTDNGSKLGADLKVGRAAAYTGLGKTELALPDLLQAYRIYVRIGYKRGQAAALLSLGSLYLVGRDYRNAIKYYQQAAAVSAADPIMLASIYASEGRALKELGRPSQAVSRLRQALLIANRLNSPVLTIRMLSDLADAQLAAGQLSGAAKTIATADRLREHTPVGDWNIVLNGSEAALLYKRGDPHGAAKALDRVLMDRTSPMGSREYYFLAYKVYKDLDQPDRSLAFLERYRQLDDQARTIASSTASVLMAARFDFANQNIRIAQLRERESQQQALIARQRLRMLLIVLAGVGLMSVLLVIGYVSIRRSRNQVRAANDELTTTNTELEHALAARTEFLATTSHEIRTPLNGILGMTQVILADKNVDGGVRERLELVRGAGETMKALVDDILDVAKLATGELRIHRAEMPLRQLLRDASRMWEAQAATKEIAVALDIADAPDRIVEDEVRLRQIVFNLMANAIKFTDRGSVRLAVSVREGDGGERLHLSVIDTGIGIPTDRLEDIFESFKQVDGGTTRRHGGTGLGLAICRSLARAMGGDVTVSSVLGVGSTFLLDLPLERAAGAPNVTASGVSALDQAQLVLVEANPLNRSILGALLAPQLAGATTVDGLDEALATLTRGPVDLVLADAATLDGDMAAAQRLAAAAAARGARTVLLWSTPDATLLAAAEAAGIHRVIAKPIAAQELVSALKAIYDVDSSDDPVEIAA